jgi:excisionase family DNA binding protein
MILIFFTVLLGVLSSAPGRRAGKIARKFITMAEAADWLGVSVDTVRRRIAHGQLEGYQMPGSRLIFLKIADVETLIESGKIPTGGWAAS